jgi:hypothetical protein
VRFRRKSTEEPEAAAEDEAGEPGAEAAGDAAEVGSPDVPSPDVPSPDVPSLDVRRAGPYDISEVADDEMVERVDLGSLLIAPAPGRELRLQVDEASQAVQSVLVAGPDGAVEVRAFAAPRNGDLWSEARHHLAADTAQHGGTATEREGRFGVELICQRPVQTPDGKTAMQPSRVVGINGPRWFLRGTFLGKPALTPEDSADWDDTLAGIVVNRGSHAMPSGDALPLTLPANARRAT